MSLVCVHVPPLAQGEGWQGWKGRSQCVPAYSGGQWQRYEPTSFIHAPLFWQGEGVVAHSFTSWRHVGP